MVRGLNSSMAHMQPLFDKNLQFDESELVDSLANKAPRRHKAMLISQGFNQEMGDLSTFVEKYEKVNATDNISMAKFYASDEDSDTKKKMKRSRKFKEREEKGKKQCKNSSPFCSIHGENNGNTLMECKVLKARASYKDKPKYGKNDYKKRFKELNLLQAEAAHKKSKYEKLNKYFIKRNTSKGETVVLYDSSDSDYSSSSESNHSNIETGKHQLPMIQILLTMMKSSAVPLATRIRFESTVADIHL